MTILDKEINIFDYQRGGGGAFVKPSNPVNISATETNTFSGNLSWPAEAEAREAVSFLSKEIHHEVPGMRD